MQCSVEKIKRKLAKMSGINNRKRKFFNNNDLLTDNYGSHGVKRYCLQHKDCNGLLTDQVKTWLLRELSCTLVLCGTWDRFVIVLHTFFSSPHVPIVYVCGLIGGIQVSIAQSVTAGSTYRHRVNGRKSKQDFQWFVRVCVWVNLRHRASWFTMGLICEK